MYLQVLFLTSHRSALKGYNCKVKKLEDGWMYSQIDSDAITPLATDLSLKKRRRNLRAKKETLKKRDSYSLHK